MVRSYSLRPINPIVTEHFLLYRKEKVLLIPFSHRKYGEYQVDKADSRTIIWFQLIRLTMEAAGGMLSQQELYAKLEQHSKVKQNQNYQAHIRASIYEHRRHFQTNCRGIYRIAA